MSNFHINQRVRCIDDSPGDTGRYPQYRLVEGNIYTVSACKQFDQPAIQIAEHHFPRGCYLRANRFRAVRTTSIEIFRSMLVSSNERTPA